MWGVVVCLLPSLCSYLLYKIGLYYIRQNVCREYFRELQPIGKIRANFLPWKFPAIRYHHTCHNHYATEKHVCGTFLGNASPHMHFRWVLVEVLELLPEAFSVVAFQLKCGLICESDIIESFLLIYVIHTAVELFFFVCIGLAISGCGICPSKFVVYLCNSSFSIANMCHPHFFLRMSLRSAAVSSLLSIIVSSLHQMWSGTFLGVYSWGCSQCCHLSAKGWWSFGLFYGWWLDPPEPTSSLMLSRVNVL